MVFIGVPVVIAFAITIPFLILDKIANDELTEEEILVRIRFKTSL
jgi:hypothetical protein